MFLLENVKNLKSHDKGNTYRVIKETLAELNYKFNDAVLDAINYVPQHRERIYIIGYDARRFNNDISIKFPSPPEGKKKLATILEKDVDKNTFFPIIYGIICNNMPKNTEAKVMALDLAS